MNQSDLNNPIWRKILLNEVDVALTYLPAKIMLSSARIKIKLSNNNDSEIQNAIQDLFNLYLKGEVLPNAKKDIELLLKN